MSRLLLDIPRVAGSGSRLRGGKWLPRRMSATSLPLAGFPVRDTRSDQLARFLHQRLRQGRKIAVGFVNQNFVISCRDFGHPACADDGLILVNDGIGMQLAALLRFGRGFRENLNGTDFVPRFLRESRQPVTVFLVGGEPAVLRRAAAVLGALPQCRIVGQCDGFSLWEREAAVVREIASASPDILLVGLGNPIQERWVLQHWHQLDARIIFGVGALFDWLSGHRRRAPLPIRRLRLEWLYRLALEPRRLCRRYTLGILQFFALVVAQPPARLHRKVSS